MMLASRGAAALLLILVAPLGAIAQEPPAPSGFVYPIDVAVGESGEAYVVDLKLPGVWRVKDGKAEIFVRGSRRFKTPLNAARCVIQDKQGLLIGDSASTSVLRIVDGKATAAHEGRIGIPMDLAMTKAGDILVADLDLRRIWKFPAAGGKPELFAKTAAPRGLFVDDKDRVWVVCHGRDQVIRFDAEGKNPEVVVKGRPFRFPNQIVVNAAGDAFIADGFAKAIWKVPAGGEPTKLVDGGPLRNPVGLALHGDALWVADPHAKAVFEVKTADGAIRKVVGAE